jgi:lysophospholipase
LIAASPALRVRTGHLIGQGGARLFVQSWLPESDPEGVIVLVHGLAEHSGRYDEMVGRLAALRYAVYALDHRGHGRSEGPRANIERFEYLTSDLDRLVALVERTHPGLPLTMLGHSMGGAVAFAYALRHEPRLSGLVLSAPLLAVDPNVPALRITVARLASALLPGVGALKLPSAAISRDAAVVRAYEQDPLVFCGSIPARTLAELFDAVASFPQQAPRLRLPVLILHGTADQLVRLAHVERIYASIGSRDKTVRRYEGLYHEVFNEPERSRVFQDLEEWLKAQAATSDRDRL